MKVTILQNMAGPIMSYRKGKEYDVEEETALSFIASGHAVSAEKETVKKEVVETAVKPKAENTKKPSYKK